MTDVAKFYDNVIDSVINGMKETFTEDGMDTQVLEELKKLWKTKLSDTHVVDPEPVPQTAVQYAQRLQAGQFQMQPTVAFNRMPIPSNPNQLTQTTLRTLAPIARPNAPLSSGNIGSKFVQQNQQPQQMMSGQGVAVLRPSMNQQGARQPIVLASALNPMVQQHQVMQLQQQRPNNAVNIAIRGGIPVTTGQPTLIAPGATVNGMQTATLAGQNLQIVQMGNHTYLVPMPIRPQTTMVGQQQQQQQQQQQFQQDANGNTILQVSAFNRTQVDGRVDGSEDEEDDYTDQFSEGPSSIRQPMSVNSLVNPRSRPSQHAQLSSDEDDDDDMVPATPGLTPPASALSATGLTPRPRTHRNTPHHQPIPTPTIGGTHMPMTPRTKRKGSPARTPPIASLKRPAVVGSGKGSRHQFHPPNDFDVYDEDDEYDENESHVTMMTPASQRLETVEDDEEGMRDTPGSTMGATPLTGRSNDIKPSTSTTRIANLSMTSSKLVSKTEATTAVGQRTVPEEDDETAGLLPEADDPAVAADEDEEDPEEDEDDEPLNSQDDVSEEEPDSLFESENLVVCQYEKVNRSRNKWRFILRDGVMMIHGRDHVFQKVIGEAEW